MVCPLNLRCVRRWHSLDGFTYEKSKALPIGLAKVPTLYRIAVGRNLESWWRYERRPMFWPRNFLRIRLSGSWLSWPKLAKARSGLMPTFQRREKKLAVSTGLYNSPILLDVAQESRLSPSRVVVLQPQLTCWQLKSPTRRLGCGNVGMVVGVSRERGGL